MLTRELHGLINKRKVANSIVAIKNYTCSLTTSSKQVGELFVEYYKGLFGNTKGRERIEANCMNEGQGVVGSNSILSVQ